MADPQMDVDTSVEEMEVDAWEMESAIEFCTSMKGFRKFATWKNEEDVVGTVVKPDKGRPWRPTTTHYVEQRRWRRMFFIPGNRDQRKNALFVKGCVCNAVDDACRWCLHFNVCYSASGLAEAAAQHRATSFFAPQVVPMLAAAFFE